MRQVVETHDPLSTSDSARLEARGITKRYDTLVANDRVDVSIGAGEIVALLGENGAGKSTLVNVLAGLTSPDAGELRLAGSPVPFGNPSAALAAGIGVVHQHFMLVDRMTVAENVALSFGRSQPWRVDLDEVGERLVELGARHGLSVAPHVPVERLSVGERQRVEILKLLVRDSRMIILDEPSAVLTPMEWGRLAEVLTGLAASGTGIMLITHKLDEISDVAQQCTVMRHGRVVASVPVADTDSSELARLMVGRDVNLRSERTRSEAGEPVLRVKQLTLSRYRGGRDLGPIDLTVNAGEVVGIAGVEGNGQTEFAALVAGERSAYSGSITVSSRTESGRGVIGVIPEDRRSEGLALSMSIEDNLVMRDIRCRSFMRRGVLRRAAIRSHAQRLVETYDIRCASTEMPVGELSGGNQQKIVLARELDRDPDLLVAAQPTRGLDVGAIEFVHGRINEHKRNGGATLLISAELDELFALSDRIGVMSGGQLRHVVPVDRVTRDTIGELMTGGLVASSEVL